ncbi:uncharacterized protein EDB93DRAFT_1091774, partial [Suillus bovinus]|uniref:uncharacterized protein n=1 Tax=Suillus bovinus TaxID=48563 RepID=UPI001B86088F
TGAGKSSVINLMIGQQIPHVSPNSRRWTPSPYWTEYQITFENGTRYKVFDTVSLKFKKPPHLQTAEYLSKISDAYRPINTLKELGCRVTATMQSSYGPLFFEFLCEENVPLVLVITTWKERQRWKTGTCGIWLPEEV